MTAPAWYCQWTGCGRDTLFGDFVHPWGPERIADGFLPVLALLDDHSIEIGAIAERWPDVLLKEVEVALERIEPVVHDRLGGRIRTQGRSNRGVTSFVLHSPSY